MALVQGRIAEAQSHYAEVLIRGQEIGFKVWVLYCLLGLTAVAAEDKGRMKRAVPQLAGATEALREAVGTTLEPFEKKLFDEAVDKARSQLGEEAFDNAWSAGQRLGQDEAVAYALEE